MSLRTYRHHHEKHFRKVIVEWKELKTGKRDYKKVSNTTKLFISALEKNGLDADLILQNEINNDLELQKWLNGKLDLTD
jgi:hypothetical protein